jgi:hypothetical protein
MPGAIGMTAGIGKMEIEWKKKENVCPRKRGQMKPG